MQYLVEEQLKYLELVDVKCRGIHTRRENSPDVNGNLRLRKAINYKIVSLGRRSNDVDRAYLVTLTLYKIHSTKEAQSAFAQSEEYKCGKKKIVDFPMAKLRLV